MAVPVPMKQLVQADPREELVRRIQDAVAHADAVLSPYELLQQLHDTGRWMYSAATSAREMCW
jgi:hypothetical protein